MNDVSGNRSLWSRLRIGALRLPPPAEPRPKGAVLILLLVLAAGCAREPKDVRFLERGKQFLAKKDYARAAIEFQNAAAANPKNAEASYQRALAELAVGDKIAAYRALSRTLELDGGRIDAQLKLAELLVTGSDPEDIKAAQEHAQAVLNASPDNPDALDAMAVAELRLGKRAAALELLEQASRKAPQHLQTAIELALLRLEQKDQAGAERLMKQAVEKSPESLEARVALGAFYSLMGNSRESERELRIVLEKDPNHTLALLNLAILLHATGRESEAAEMYRRLATGPSPAYRSAYATYLFQIGKQKEAVAEFERVARQNPRDIDLRTRLVAAYVATQRTADAQRVLDEALRKNPKDAAALLQRSDLRIMAGAYADARKDLLQVLHYTPDSATAHFLLSKVDRAARNPLTERQELLESLRLDPRFFAARIDLARSYIAAGDSQSALDLMNHTPEDQQKELRFIEYRNWALLASGDLKDLQTGIGAGLAKARTRDLLLQDALLKLRQGNDPAARPALLEILKSNPEDLGAVDVLVRSYAARKQLPLAIENVRALIGERPNSAPLRFRLGVLLAAVGQSRDARAAFTAALTANPLFPPARLALAQMDRGEGKPDAARQDLDPLLSSKDGELWARLELGFIEAKTRNYDKSIEHFRKVVEADPGNVVALNNLAYLLADHTNQTDEARIDEAMTYAQKAKELAPDDVTVEGTLGWAYFRKGMYGLAVQHLQNAVSREGKNVIDGTAIRQYHLAMAYSKTGDENGAAKALGAGLKLDPNLPEAQVAAQMIGKASK